MSKLFKRETEKNPFPRDCLREKERTRVIERKREREGENKRGRERENARENKCPRECTWTKERKIERKREREGEIATLASECSGE